MFSHQNDESQRYAMALSYIRGVLSGTQWGIDHGFDADKARQQALADIQAKVDEALPARTTADDRSGVTQ